MGLYMIVPIWKRKGDVHDPGKYRGITLLMQVLKLLERVLDARIRSRVEGDSGEVQQGFRNGTMYVLRQMVVKRLEAQGSMALGFEDMEKAFDTVPREMVMATLRWMGVPEAEVRMVEVTYEKTTARVVVGEGASVQQRRSQDFCLGGGAPGTFSVISEADQIQWGEGVVAEIFP